MYPSRALSTATEAPSSADMLAHLHRLTRCARYPAAFVLGIALMALAGLPGVGHTQAPIAASESTLRASPSQPATSPIRVLLSGDVRTRSEWDRPGGALPSDMFTYLRTRLGVRVDALPGVQFVLQAQDSRVLGAEGNPAAASVEEFGLHQAFVELRATGRGIAVALRAGRQEIALGNERLIGVVGWSNVGRSFDGARLMLSQAPAPAGGEAWSATAFAATVEERGRHFGPDVSRAQHDHVVAGIAATSMAGDALVDVTVLYDAGGSYRGFVDADRATFDVRLRTPDIGRIGAELEGAWQVGRQRDADDTSRVRDQHTRAWLAAVRIGVMPAAGRRATFVVGADLLSGDASPHDKRYEAFSTMYGSNHIFYGLMDAIGDPAGTTRERGLLDLLISTALVLHRRVAVRAEMHRFALASGENRNLGWEADVVVPVQLLPTASIEVGYSAFRAGSSASAAALGTKGSVREWAFLQLRVGF